MAVRRLWVDGHVRWVVLIFCVGFALRVAWTFHSYPDNIVFTTDPVLYGDEQFYNFTARSLAAGEGFRDPFTHEFTTAFPPGYPMVLASFLVVFGRHLLVAKLLNVSLAALTGVLAYALATVVCDRRAGIVAGGLMALFPGQILFSSLIMTEPLFTVLSVLLVLWLTVWLRSAGGLSYQQAGLLGLSLGFMSLVRAEALLLVPALPVLWKLAGVPWRRIARCSAVLLGTALLVLAPLTARNYARFHEFILLRGGSGDPARVLRIGLSTDYNNDYKYGYLHEEPKGLGSILRDYADRPWLGATVPGRKLADLYGTDDAIYYVRGEWLSVYYQPPILSDREAAGWARLSNWYYYAVGAVVLLGTPVWWSRWRGPLLALLWFIASWTLMHLIIAPDFRYHFPLIPMVCVLAALAIIGAWDIVTGKRRVRPIASPREQEPLTTQGRSAMKEQP